MKTEKDKGPSLKEKELALEADVEKMGEEQQGGFEGFGGANTEEDQWLDLIR